MGSVPLRHSAELPQWGMYSSQSSTEGPLVSRVKQSLNVVVKEASSDMKLIETLTVRDFGPIADLSLDFKRITLLIGPSASGKSTLLKIVAMMRHILKVQLVRSVLRDFHVKGKNLPRLRSESYIHNAGFDTYFRTTTLISYMVYVNGRKFEIEIDGSRRIRVLGDVPDRLVYKVAFLTDMRSALAMWTEGGARSVARGLKSLDYYFGETFDLWTKALEAMPSEGLPLQHFPGMRVFSRRNAFHQRIVNVHSEGQGECDFRLVRAASGLKTSIPLVVMMDYLSRGSIAGSESFRKDILEQAFESGFNGAQVEGAIGRLGEYGRSRTLVSVQIEEPEISLDPGAQVELLRTMVCSAMDCADDRVVTLAFATHSPYVLTSLNDLIMAENHVRLKEGIQAPQHSLANQIAAWQIKDGGATNLVDANTGFVSADEMDSVSETLGDRICEALSERRES